MSFPPLRATSEQPTGPLLPTSPNRIPSPAPSPRSSPVDTLESASPSQEQIPLPSAVVEQAHSNQETNTPHQNPPLPDVNHPPDDALLLGLFPALSQQTVEAFREVEALVRNHQSRLEKQLALDPPHVDPELLGPAIIVSILDTTQSILSAENRLKLNRLLTEDTPLSEGLRGLAIIATSMHGDVIFIDDEILINTDDGVIINTLDRLLANGEISIQHRGEAIVDCIHPPVINRLLQTGVISEEHQIHAIIQASRWIPGIRNIRLNQLLTTEMIDQLFAQGPIENESRGVIITALASLDHSLERLNRLLISGPISNDHFNQALRAAVQWGQVQNTWRLTRDGFNLIQRLLYSFNACINQALPQQANFFGLHSVHNAASRGQILHAWRLSRGRYNLIQRLLFCVSAGISRILL